MKQGFSIYLDALRFLAALAVVISHLAYPRFTQGDLQWARDWNIGSDAVILFFVLSGLVIAFAAERDGSGARFAFNRMTRLWSVMIPAIMLTLLLDWVGAWLNPVSYDGWWYSAPSLAEFAIRGVTFTNQWFFDPIRLGTNGPLWSLSYEAAYYLLYGFAVFLKGSLRILCLMIAVAMIGVNALVLMPVWLFGVILWRVIKRPALPISPTASVLLAALLPAFYFAAQMQGLPGVLLTLTRETLQSIGISPALQFSEQFLWHTLLGVFFALHLMGMVGLLRGGWHAGLTSAIRWLAGASFTIYVLHYPALQFLSAILPSEMPVRHAGLLLATLAVCFLVAEVTERRLHWLRGLLR